MLFPVYLTCRLYNIKNIEAKHHRLPLFWLKTSCFWMLPSKLWILVRKIGQARQKSTCKVMKYWVCFHNELTLTSFTSCDLAKILMMCDSFYSQFALLPYFRFLAKKKALQFLISWPRLTPYLALFQLVCNGMTKICCSFLLGWYYRKPQLAKRTVLKYFSIMA